MNPRDNKLNTLLVALIVQIEVQSSASEEKTSFYSVGSVFFLGSAFSHSACFPLTIATLRPCSLSSALDCHLHPEPKYFDLLSSSNS